MMGGKKSCGPNFKRVRVDTERRCFFAQLIAWRAHTPDSECIAVVSVLIVEHVPPRFPAINAWTLIPRKLLNKSCIFVNPDQLQGSALNLLEEIRYTIVAGHLCIPTPLLPRAEEDGNLADSVGAGSFCFVVSNALDSSDRNAGSSKYVLPAGVPDALQLLFDVAKFREHWRSMRATSGPCQGQRWPRP